ncbi:MAG: transporter [Chitinophagaceae bacterium]|nr:transporter [Chitinophagaceae bacterium]
MLKRFILLTCLLCGYCFAQAQVKKKIKKGRRNKSQSQFIADKNYLQAEWEVGHETINDELSTTVYPNLTLRYGISKQLEVNAEMNFITATDRSAQPKNTTGTEPVMIGANWLLLSETKKRPAVIFSAQIAIPFLAGKNFTAKYWAPLLQVNLEKPFGQKFIVGAGSGVFWDGFLPDPSFIYNVSGTYNAGKKIALAAEFSGFINGSPPQHNADLSITYTVNKQVQLGATAGTGISPAAHKNYFGINGVWGCSLKKRNG